MLQIPSSNYVASETAAGCVWRYRYVVRRFGAPVSRDFWLWWNIVEPGEGRGGVFVLRTLCLKLSLAKNSGWLFTLGKLVAIVHWRPVASWVMSINSLVSCACAMFLSVYIAYVLCLYHVSVQPMSCVLVPCLGTAYDLCLYHVSVQPMSCACTTSRYSLSPALVPYLSIAYVLCLCHVTV